MGKKLSGAAARTGSYNIYKNKKIYKKWYDWDVLSVRHRVHCKVWSINRMIKEYEDNGGKYLKTPGVSRIELI